MGFDGAWADGDSDINLDQTLSLNVQPAGMERVHIRGLLWMEEDLDSDESPYSALRSINDGYDSDLRARLLHLYAEIDDPWGDSTLRIGRQRIIKGAAYNRIDGLYFEKRMARWDWYAFAGARASLYEDSHNDLILGGGLSFRPFHGTRVALDGFYGEEHRERWDTVPAGAWAQWFGFSYPRNVKRDLNDTLIALSLQQDLWANATGFARLTFNDGDAEELTLNLSGWCEAWDLAYELRYRRQMDSIGERVNDLTGYYRILGVYEQYDDYLLVLTKAFSEKFSLSLEAELHDTNGDTDYIGGNRDYQRLALVAAVEDLFPTIDAEAVLERWRVEGGEGTWTVTGEVTKSWKDISLTLGADYEQYEDRIAVYSGAFDTLAAIGSILAPGAIPAALPVSPFGRSPWIVETHESIYSFYGKTRWSIRGQPRTDGQRILRSRRRPRIPLLAPARGGTGLTSNGEYNPKGREVEYMKRQCRILFQTLRTQRPLLLVLGMGLVVTACATIGAVKTLGGHDRGVRIPHEIHTEDMACADCHALTDDGIGYPAHDTCELCHEIDLDKMDPEACAVCHTNEDFEITQRPQNPLRRGPLQSYPPRRKRSGLHRMPCRSRKAISALRPPHALLHGLPQQARRQNDRMRRLPHRNIQRHPAPIPRRPANPPRFPRSLEKKSTAKNGAVTKPTAPSATTVRNSAPPATALKPPTATPSPGAARPTASAPNGIAPSAPSATKKTCACNATRTTPPSNHRGLWGGRQARHCQTCHFPAEQNNCTVCHEEIGHRMAPPSPHKLGSFPAPCTMCHPIAPGRAPHPTNRTAQCAVCH